MTALGNTELTGGPGYRIYLAQDGKELIILFGGGTKKTQQSDIEQAKELYQDYKNRKKKVGKVETKKEIKNKKRE